MAIAENSHDVDAPSRSVLIGFIAFAVGFEATIFYILSLVV